VIRFDLEAVQFDLGRFADRRGHAPEKGRRFVLSFATIVYSKDYPLLRLQAMSMARFVAPDQLASIHVILNDIDEAGLAAKIEPILQHYGPLRPKVRILKGEEVLLGEGHTAKRPLKDRILIEDRYRLPLIRKGGWRGNNGYRLQQVLKLGAARVAEAENIVILDTKNLFLRSFEEGEFFSPKGPARIQFMPVHSDYHRNWLLQSLEALGVEQTLTDDLRTTTFSTPFPVRRTLILSLLDEINIRYGSVQALFASKRRPSEFMLMNAFCLKSRDGYAPWFEPADPAHIGMWPTYSTDELAKLVARLQDDRSLTLGLHNRAVANLPEDLRGQVYAALETRSICDRQVTEEVLQQTSALSS
jgi:hypothetical protein